MLILPVNVSSLTNYNDRSHNVPFAHVPSITELMNIPGHLNGLHAC